MKKIISSHIIFILAFGIIFMPTKHANAALVDNLRACYTLEDVNDDYVNGYDLTNNNSVTFVSAKIDNGGDFERDSSQDLNIGSILGTTAGGAMSMAGWVKVEDAPTSGQRYHVASLAAGGTSPYVAYLFGYENSGGTLRIFANRQRMAVANNETYYNTTLTAGTFYHLVYTYDGTNDELYLDGSSVIGPTSKTGDGTAHGGSDEFVLGELHADQAKHWDGIIDEFAVWSAALSSDDVSDLYNGGSGISCDTIINGPSVIEAVLSQWL